MSLPRPTSSAFSHPFAFDPTHGYSPEDLLRIDPPESPADFAEVWRDRYARASARPPVLLHRQAAGTDELGRPVFDLRFSTGDGCVLNAWLVLPATGEPARGLVVGHGYGVDDGLDSGGLPFARTALLFPFFRGLARSRCASIPAEVDRHVVHGIEDSDTYVLGGCAVDLWASVRLLEALFPAIAGRIGYLGHSFGGGVGALALPWEPRVARAAFVVPTFGHQLLRLTLPTVGSGASVQAHVRAHPGVAERALVYHDAASAARELRIPTFCACAVFDPAVAPAGQFAIYNAIPGAKKLHLLRAGHFEYPGSAVERENLASALVDFFGDA